MWRASFRSIDRRQYNPDTSDDTDPICKLSPLQTQSPTPLLQRFALSPFLLSPRSRRSCGFCVIIELSVGVFYGFEKFCIEGDTLSVYVSKGLKLAYFFFFLEIINEVLAKIFPSKLLKVVLFFFFLILYFVGEKGIN